MNENIYSFDLNCKVAGQELLEMLDSVLNDSDADDEKIKIKDFLQEASSLLEVCLLGEFQNEQESLLSLLFSDVISRKENHELMFLEHRYGEENIEFQVNPHLIRKFEKTQSLQGVSVVEIPKLALMKQEAQELCEKYLQRCDVLLVAFDADDIDNLEIWDKLEKIESKKIVFVIMTIGDKDSEQLKRDKERLAQYAMEENLDGPVYSLGELKELRNYVNKHIIGNNPKLQKQFNNVMQLKGLLSELSQSYQLRKKQYQQDVLVVAQINKSMDAFIMDNQKKVDGLKAVLKNDICVAIQKYEDEIVNKLDPMQIKERFPRGNADFIEYLNFINESYQVRMTDNVNRKTQETVRSYLKELEITFDEATGFLRERESLISLEDKFYGTMAVSKQQVVRGLKNDLNLVRDYYRSLSSASSELFYKLWAERDRYDRKVNNATVAGAVGGAIASVGAVVGGAGAMGAIGAVSGGAAGAIAAIGVLWPVVAAIVGGVFISHMAKKISSSKNMAEMKKNVQEAIEDFKLEVSKTRENIVTQIMDTLDAMFKQELEAADSAFADFRLSVNIDGRNILLMDENLEKINTIMAYLEGRLIQC